MQDTPATDRTKRPAARLAECQAGPTVEECRVSKVRTNPNGLLLAPIPWTFLVCLLTCLRLTAMTPDEFVKFLAAPPTHGRAVVIIKTPQHGQGAAITNMLWQDYQFSWNGSDVLTVQREGDLLAESGAIDGVEWDHLRGHVTRYAGTNHNDLARRRSSLNGSYANLMALGVYYLVKGTARSDDRTLTAEIDMPQAYERFGSNPRLLGELSILPDGRVGSMKYIVQAEQYALLRFRIDYAYSGKWGTGFPSRIAVYELSAVNDEATREAARLLYEVEVLEWDVSSGRPRKGLDPSVLFPFAYQHVLSNNVLYDVGNGRTSRMGGEKPSRAKRLVVIFAILAASVPCGIYAWRATRNQNETHST